MRTYFAIRLELIKKNQLQFHINNMKENNIFISVNSIKYINIQKFRELEFLNDSIYLLNLSNNFYTSWAYIPEFKNIPFLIMKKIF